MLLVCAVKEMEAGGEEEGEAREDSTEVRDERINLHCLHI